MTYIMKLTKLEPDDGAPANAASPLFSELRRIREHTEWVRRTGNGLMCVKKGQGSTAD